MTAKPPAGLFITGTDTNVGKTYVARTIITALRCAGRRVGAYKPAASGCRQEGAGIVSDDAQALWEATGRLGSLDWVCPQRFVAPLAPYLAARRESRSIDVPLLRNGIDRWQDQCDCLIVEGAGGLMSPLAERLFVADVARQIGFPLVIVAANRIGVIHQVVQTVLVAERIAGLRVAAVVLNTCSPLPADESQADNAAEVRTHASVPVVTLAWNAAEFQPQVCWPELLARGEVG